MDVTSTANSAVASAKSPSTNLTQLEQDTLAGLSGDDYKRAYAQLMLQKQQETVSFVSNVMKKRNEIAMVS
ncbi:MAG TPA: hypothetical protein VF815_35275, partial [Myxococcaceae bacterium]